MQTTFGILLEKLKDARKAATLETSVFDDALKERVKLHHRTWIICPLDEAIALLEAAERGEIKVKRRWTYRSITRMPEIAGKQD